MTDYDYRMRARSSVILMSDDAAQSGVHTQYFKIVAGNNCTAHQIGLVVTVEAGSDPTPGDQASHDLILIAQFGVVRIRENAADSATEDVDQSLRIRNR